MQILIAEDSKIIRRTLETTVASWGYEVICASDGQDAWERVQRESPDIIITDWMMPGMDGPTLCQHVRNGGFQHYIYIILLTALDDTQSLVDGMQAGADDFVRKPLNLAELRARLAAGERLVALEQTLQDQNRYLTELSDQLRKAHAQIQRDLTLAGEIQRTLLPPRDGVLGGIYFERMYCPSTHVSGDLLNYFRLDERHIGFYSIDVAGHGIAAAMMSVTLSRLLTPDINRGCPLKRSVAEAPHYELRLPPSQAVNALNLEFQNDTGNFLYFTMVYGVIEPDTRTLQFCQAGHPNPIYVAREGTPRLLGDGGFPVGLLPIAEYDSVTLTYEHGDRLYLYSDGVTECPNAQGEMFGPERLQALFAATGERPLGDVLKELRTRLCEWNGSEQFEDDVSVLALEFA